MKDIFDITAVILAGGLGTRLKSVVSDKPKVLATVAGKPFITYLLDQLSDAGLRKVVLCTGHMADKFVESLGNNYGSLKLFYSKEDEPLGTAGAIRLAMPLLSSNTILVMNGDSYIDTDLKSYIKWFLSKEREASLLLTNMDDTSRYGRVCTDKDENIVSFEEKSDMPGMGWINAGIYLLQKSVIAGIPQGRFYSLEREFFPGMIGKKLFGFRAEGRLIDIGTPQSYTEAQELFSVKNCVKAKDKCKEVLHNDY